MTIETGQMYRWTDRSGSPGFWVILDVDFCGGEEVVRYAATNDEGLLLPNRGGHDFLPLREVQWKVRDGAWTLHRQVVL